MKKWSTFICLFCAMNVFAQTITTEQASRVCERFIAENYPNASEKMPQLSFEKAYFDGTNPFLYRFSIENKGFVLVSNSQKVMPILAYSFDDNFEMIPPVESIFEHYKQVIQRTEKGDAPVDVRSVNDWKRYLSEDFIPNGIKQASRAPLLTTRWNQNMFYNTYCPWDAAAGSYYDYRVPTGCVATAFTQIMNYHRFPERGQGATTYIPPGYPRQTVYFNQHSYNWDAMCNDPLSYANEIAKISHHFGVAIQMGYTADGSGAGTQEASHEMSQKFKYDLSISNYNRALYQTPEEVRQYLDLLEGEIDAHRPIYHAGCNQQMNSCHAYVLDDYDDLDRFHINYGWGGASNGYYALDNFVSGSTHWDYGSDAVVNIFPSGAIQSTYCQGHQRNTASFGYVADGSPTAKPYQSNPDCSWMVAVPEATSYTFSFDRLDLNPDVDFVTIYNGPTVESGVKATFTGTTLPTGTYTVTADSVLITFTSTGALSENNNYYGFLMSYKSEIPTGYCHGTTVLTDWTNYIGDESSDNVNYRPQTNCTWNINHNYISGYAFTFTKFDLGYGDFVDVYNNSTNPPTLYKRFDIYNLPESEIFNVNFKKMKVNFVSDNWDQADGFVMGYYAIASIEDHSGLTDITIYPNPATSNLFVNFYNETSAAVTCTLFDATGKSVLRSSVEAQQGENKISLDVSALCSGFYMMEIATPTGKNIQKVMVR